MIRRLSLILLAFSFILSAEANALCETGNSVVLRVTSDGDFTANSAALRTPEEVNKIVTLHYPVIVRALPSEKAYAVLKALELLSDGGALTVKLASRSGAFKYCFPVADGGKSTPWYDLALLVGGATPISPHVLIFPHRKDSVLVIVTVKKGSLSCDNYQGSLEIAHLLRDLKKRYSLVAINLEVAKTATYSDMADGLEAANKASLESYYFSRNGVTADEAH